MKRRKKTLLSRLMKKADTAVSLLVRWETNQQYGHCPLCPDQDKANPVQACFHFVRRKRTATRWNTRNLVGSCHRCNWIEYRNPDPSRAWFIRNRGVALYLEIVDKSMAYFKPTVADLEEIIFLATSDLEGKKRYDQKPGMSS